MAVSKVKVKEDNKKTTKVAKKETVESTSSTTKVEKKTGSLTAQVVDITGKSAGTLTLPQEMFGAKINPILMAQAVRVYLANQRAGTAKTKSRGEVNKTTAKAWRQKGTGRARHGAKSAPIWVGGGVAFGPKPRDYSLQLPKKMKKAALFSALSARLKDGAITIVSGMDTIEPKTKKMAGLLKALSLDTKKRTILLITATDKENIEKAVRNLEGVSFTAASRINTYDVLNHKNVILMKESVEVLQKHFLKA